MTQQNEQQQQQQQSQQNEGSLEQLEQSTENEQLSGQGAGAAVAGAAQDKKLQGPNRPSV